MHTPGSARERDAVPALLSPAVVLLGVYLMSKMPGLVGPLALRPALVLSELALVAPALAAAAALGVGLAGGVGLRALDRRTGLLSLAAGGTLWAASLGVFELQYVFWRPPSGYLEAFRRLHDALRPAGPFDAVVSVLAIAIAPAVCEEIVFRGVVLPSFVRPFGPAGAGLASALLFGLIHLDLTPGPAGHTVLSLYRVPFSVVIGTALAAMRLWTGALSPTILAHATLNTITFLAAPLTDDPSRGLPEAHPLLAVSLLLAGGGASAMVLRALRPASSSLTRPHRPA